jgi:hypothetical protein
VSVPRFTWTESLDRRNHIGELVVPLSWVINNSDFMYRIKLCFWLCKLVWRKP